MSYQMLLSIKDIDFSKKKVLIIGAGWMAEQYCIALEHMGISNVCVVSNSEKSAKTCCEKFGFQPYYGGYEKCLSVMKLLDLVIIATPIHDLVPAALAAIECGNLNILVEKPGSLYTEPLEELQEKAENRGARVRIAYNRLIYPSYWKLKELVQEDGGITSCRYTFTELIRSINFEKDRKDVYRRWGIANSLHVIGMAHSLIGMPKELFSRRQGSLPWHSSGSVFVGAGITEKDIPFSYHADWGSAGRWGIEIMTPKNAFRLIPLEQLHICPKGSFTWNCVETTSAFPEVKQGVAEEIAIMLDHELEKDIPLVTLEKAVDFARLSEEIFKYLDRSH